MSCEELKRVDAAIDELPRRYTKLEFWVLDRLLKLEKLPVRVARPITHVTRNDQIRLLPALDRAGCNGIGYRGGAT